MKLLLQSGRANDREWRIGSRDLTIGSDPTHDIVLWDPAVSGFQARVFILNGDPFVENCAGTDAARLDNRRLPPGDPRILSPGSSLQIGHAVLYVATDDEAVPAIEGAPIGVPVEEAPPPFAPERLRIVGELCEIMLRQGDRKVFFEKIVDAIFHTLDVRRAFLALRDGDTRRLVRLATRNLDGDDPDAPIEVSGTILSRTVPGGNAQILADAMSAEDLAKAESVAGFAIRSVLCVPIRLRGKPEGLIYADNRNRASSFTDEDLEYLRMIGRFAGLVLEKVEARERQSRLIRELQARLRAGVMFVHASPRMDEALELVKSYARTRETVLLTGASGTGKELVARTLHRPSSRREGPFVPVNCAALPEGLLERELFGHERGAFTGADRRSMGLFEAADGGTLFLDEIGEMSAAGQATLLRVLDGHPFVRVGGIEPVTSHVRIIVATNRDLGEAVAEGAFRQDLYFRVQVLSIDLPPLRDRPEDILLLAEFFLDETTDCPPTLDDAVEQALLAYSWPGNVRELKNVIRGASVRCRGGRIRLRDLPVAIARDRSDLSNIEPLAQIVGRHVARTVDLTGGNIREAARILGVSRGTIYRNLPPGKVPRRRRPS